MCILNFFEEYNGAIVAIATVVLVIVTWVSTCSTNRMVNIAQKEFEITNRPYISANTIEATERKGGGITYVVSLTNSGKLPAVTIKKTVVAKVFKVMNTPITDIDKSFLINPGETIRLELIDIKPAGLNEECDVFMDLQYKTINSDKLYSIKYTYKYLYNPSRLLVSGVISD